MPFFEMREKKSIHDSFSAFFLKAFLAFLLSNLFALPNANAQGVYSSASLFRPETEKKIMYFHFSEALRVAYHDKDLVSGNYYLSRILFLKYVVTENPVFLDPFYSAVKATIQEAGKLPDTSPVKKVVLAESVFLRGIMRFMEKKYLACGYDLKSACTILTEQLTSFPDEVSGKKLAGIMNVALSAIPAKLSWLSSYLCFKGDITRGMKDLEEYNQSGKVMKFEVVLIQYYIEKNLYSRTDNARKIIEGVNRTYPGSYPIQYLMASAHLENRDGETALKILENGESEFANDQRVFTTPYWDYAFGRAHYYKLNYQKSIEKFDQFLLYFKGSALKADAIFRKGMAFSLSYDDVNASKEFRKLTVKSEGAYDADEYAQFMAEKYLKQSPTETERDLFRARNLFDGGFYYEALSTLAKWEGKNIILSQDVQSELWYRKGRILHESGKVDMAEETYRKAIASAPSYNLWTKVYSHYYLGKIFEVKCLKSAATEQYQAALKYKNYFYQNGLEQRCKSALSALK